MLAGQPQEELAPHWDWDSCELLALAWGHVRSTLL